MTQPAPTESKLVEAAHVWRESRVSGVLIDKSSGARLRRGEEGYAEAWITATVRKSRRWFVYKQRRPIVILLSGAREFTLHKVCAGDTHVQLGEQVFRGPMAVVMQQLFRLYEEDLDFRAFRRKIRGVPSPTVMVIDGAKVYLPAHPVMVDTPFIQAFII